MANGLIIPTPEEIEAIIEKYGRFVSPEFLRRRAPLEAEVTRFCDAKLNAEYRAVALEMLEAIELDTPETFGRGDERIWATGFWHALLQQNFGFDPALTPRIKARDIADFYGVRVGSMQQRSSFIRDALGLDTFDGRFLIPAMKAQVEEARLEMGAVVAAIAGASLDEVMADMPRFGKPRGRLREFVDRDRPVMYKFYDLTERAARLKPTTLERQIRALIADDPDFLDSYAMLAELLESQDKDEEAQQLRDEAGVRALRLICNRKGQWPDELGWGWLENRHIIRALDARAYHLWSAGQRENALEMFRHLLASNLNDNIGARHCILALRLGLDAETWSDPFATSDGYLKAQDVFEWFDRESQKFPEEFSEWRRAVGED
ncbi:hypothetical protein IAD21_03118 [Abditibacteriota bacterium]|nr:hypothetical protein IAD21_03118 [Abditibacteriota bacterium]